jgi:hypothetical protein
LRKKKEEEEEEEEEEEKDSVAFGYLAEVEGKSKSSLVGSTEKGVKDCI